MLVSNNQKSTKLFTVNLNLRMLCDQGRFCKILPQSWCPAEFKHGDDVSCHLCCNEAPDFMKDLAICPSCSKRLEPEGQDNIAASLPPLDPYSPYSNCEPTGGWLGHNIPFRQQLCRSKSIRQSYLQLQRTYWPIFRI